MNNSEIFYGELQLIKDQQLALATKDILDKLVPEYFYKVSASSTGKYHPWYSLGYGGLVRHTKAAVKIANDLLHLDMYKDLPADEIIVALLLHDTFKHGKLCETHTVTEHPLVASCEITAYAQRTFIAPIQEKLNTIVELIESHMGQWCTVENKQILPIPDTPEKQFVHLCDYLASRRYIIVEVN